MEAYVMPNKSYVMKDGYLRVCEGCLRKGMIHILSPDDIIEDGKRCFCSDGKPSMRACALITPETVRIMSIFFSSLNNSRGED
jgi:hypothetical protein